MIIEIENYLSVAQLVRSLHRTCRGAGPISAMSNTEMYKLIFKNSLIIHEENTNKNHKRVVSLYACDRDFP